MKWLLKNLGSGPQQLTIVTLAFIISTLGISCKEQKNKEATVTPAGDSSIITCEKIPARFAQNKNAPEGMTWIPGGDFIMGTNDTNSYRAEQPAHPVHVNGFFMDVTEVTNAEFKKFVDATGYITVAEIKPEWEQLKIQLPPGTPPPDEKDMVPASLVFIPHATVTSLTDYSQWWHWVPGASWKHPEGPGSNIDERMNHPVVHIAYDDALAYCKWAKKRLPTEAEWEFAARGGLTDKRYAWGDDFKCEGHFMANTFQGRFPDKGLTEDGYMRTAPVKSYAPNGYGLYDMIGNVWEWCADWFDAYYYKSFDKTKTLQDPKGPDKSFDPDEPYALKRVTRGGSFLCSDNYCINYRPSARRGTAYDSGASNVGFRCVK